MNHEPAPPAKAPELEEGIIDVNFCHNPLCSNFGLSWYQSKLIQNSKQSYRAGASGDCHNLVCKKCDKTMTLYNNQAINSMFLWTVKNTLLHEYCPNKTCENYRVNLYENWDSLYGIDEKNIYRVYCKKDEQKFTIGTPIYLTEGNKKPRVLQHFLKLVCNNVGPRGVMDIKECSGNTYLSFLNNLSALTKSISGYHLMKLHKPNHALCSETIHLYTDILKLSIRGGGGRSHSLLDYVITSTTYNKSFFILAATPAFYPDPDDELRDYIIEQEKPANVKPFNYLCDYHHVLAEGVSKKLDPKSDKYTFAPFGIGGYYIKRSYTVVAHFLLLKKILAKVGHIVHYMDAEPVLARGVISAFAQRIKADTCDVVAVKTTKESKKESKKASKKASKVIEEDEKYKAATEAEYQINITKVRADLDKAIAEYKAANKSSTVSTISPDIPNSYTKALWVEDPKPPIHEQERRFFWRTRRLSQDCAYEYELYKYGKLQPIDMPFATLRKAASFAVRPPSTASKDSAKGYDSHAELPKNVCEELAINIFYWNFQIRHLSRRYLRAKKDIKKGLRSYALGITSTQPITMKRMISWRKNIFIRAKEITKWHGI